MFKWGIIGSGKIARRFAADLIHSNQGVLSGVVSRTFSNAQGFAREFDATAFASIEDLAANVDAVYVASPHPSHHDHSLAAIEGGKPVLCEKPFAMNEQETNAMLGRARSREVFIMEAMWTRFFPAIAEVIELVESGKIGVVQKIESSFGYRSEFDSNSRVFNLALGGGSLLDVGVYSISLVRMLTEESPVEIEGTANIGPTGADESAQWKLRFSSGLVAKGHSSIIESLANEACIVGSKGEIRIPRFWCPNEYILNGKAHKRDFAGRGFQFETNEVIRCVREGLIESPHISHLHTLDVMRIMDRIRNQIGLRYPSESAPHRPIDSEFGKHELS